MPGRHQRSRLTISPGRKKSAWTDIQFSSPHHPVIVALPATPYYNIYNLRRVSDLHKNSSLLKPKISSSIVSVNTDNLYLGGNLLQFVILFSWKKKCKIKLHSEKEMSRSYLSKTVSRCHQKVRRTILLQIK